MYFKGVLQRVSLAATLAALALGAPGCGTPPASPHPVSATINEFPIPTASGEPTGISKGPDGNLWFTEMQSGQIGRSTLTGAMTEFPLNNSGAGPSAIAIGPDGKLWFDEMDGGRIGSITTAGAIQEFNLPTLPARQPTDIALGPDGFMWFTEGGVDSDMVGRITAPDANVTEYQAPTTQASPAGIVRAPDGNLYFVETQANNIARITPQGVVTEFPIPTADAGASAITVDASGNLWFTEATPGKIGEMTLAGVFTEYSTPTTSSVPGGIVLGPDCNLWFTEANGNQIGRVTTAGVFTEFPLANADSEPLGITVGPDNNIWFTESNTTTANPGKLGQLLVDPATFQAACDAVNYPPVALCQNATVNTDPNLCTAATATVDNGSSDPQGASALVSQVQAPAGPYTLGSTPVTLTLADTFGLVSACDAQVIVQDHQLPTLACGAPVVECTSRAGAAVTLSPIAADNCPGTLTPTCTPASGTVLPLGATSFNCSVTDGSGNVGTCSSTVTVRDSTPPTITSVKADPISIWPPDKRQVTVKVSVTASDACDPAPVCKVTSVTSNERLDADDWRVFGNQIVVVKADCDAHGSGRNYVIGVRCTDASGNSSTSSVTVTVPKDHHDDDHGFGQGDKGHDGPGR